MNTQIPEFAFGNTFGGKFIHYDEGCAKHYEFGVVKYPRIVLSELKPCPRCVPFLKVFISENGEVFHYSPRCVRGGTLRQVPELDAIKNNYPPCSKCSVNAYPVVRRKKK